MTYHANIHKIPETQEDIDAKKQLLFKQRKELGSQPIIWFHCTCGKSLALIMDSGAGFVVLLSVQNVLKSISGKSL